MDVIKLYGKGIEEFIPDPEFNHNISTWLLTK